MADRRWVSANFAEAVFLQVSSKVFVSAPNLYLEHDSPCRWPNSTPVTFAVWFTGDEAAAAEVLDLRHENAVLRRQIGRVRYAAGLGLVHRAGTDGVTPTLDRGLPRHARHAAGLAPKAGGGKYDTSGRARGGPYPRARKFGVPTQGTPRMRGCSWRLGLTVPRWQPAARPTL